MTDFNYFWIFKKENDKTFFPEDSGPAVPDKTRPNIEWNAISSVKQDTVKMNWKNEKKEKEGGGTIEFGRWRCPTIFSSSSFPSGRVTCVFSSIHRLGIFVETSIFGHGPVGTDPPKRNENVEKEKDF
jgi:hypothetical protein